ncbi:hypothetical protein GM661_16110 [Iocasia frigidifontis]|uniref:Uncharacterized protein n=1 Tax=Iocasia fonsfrigidae TaxID=2682810 RepID=A0A8A7KIG3_9FIRM|nr:MULTISPECIES: spore cortex biosynthesis protein YabQ [Halanaerobiaceae]AZO93130.1 hypothetical protein D7D81_00140 [Halocella sp. SP3-1]MTI60015.1 hypothetical protein [Bacillota bacterium]QTL99369.1 hypothetical protein GM661_16110 [Iocasia fonsfrigidae]
MVFLSQQLYTFVMMFLLGILIGIGFILYQYLLNRINLKSIYMNILDLFFSIIAAVVGFLVLIYANWGELRFFVILSMFLGFISCMGFKKVIRKR